MKPRAVPAMPSHAARHYHEKVAVLWAAALDRSLKEIADMSKIQRCSTKRWTQERPLGTLSQDTLVRHFGSWPEVIEAATGQRGVKGTVMNPELYVRAIYGAADKRGLTFGRFCRWVFKGDLREAHNAQRRWSSWRAGSRRPTHDQVCRDIAAIARAQQRGD